MPNVELRRGDSIEASICVVEELFLLGQFRAAAVQREFQWQRENCEALLADLMREIDHDASAESIFESDADAASRQEPAEEEVVIDLPTRPHVPPSRNRTYFLGTLVLREDGDDTLEIYDGLQRLTTLTILISTMRDFLVDKPLADRLDNLVRCSEGRWRLTLRVGSGTLGKEVQRRGETRKIRRWRDNLTEPEERLRKAASYFRRVVSEWSEERIKRFAVGLLTKVVVGLVEVRDDRLARQIFVSTNLNGLRLSRVDVFKGQLLELAENDETAGLIADRWAGICSKLDAPERGSADGEIFVYRQRQLDPFLVAIDFISRREPQGIDCLTSLGVHVQQTCRDGAAALTWLDHIDRYADAWIALHDRLEAPGDSEVDIDIWKLSVFEWPEWKPLALIWYRSYAGRRDENGRVPGVTWRAFTRRFRELHRRCLALTLAGFLPKERATIIGKALSQVDAGRDPLANALSFDTGALAKMRQAVSVPITDKSLARTIVKWIEASLWVGRPPKHLAALTVEHVLPRRTHPGQQWQKDFPDEEERFYAANSLGNLTALDWERNRDLVNAEYATKHAAYLQPPHFKSLAQVSLNDAWTAGLIEDRKRKLIEHVFTEMNLPVFTRRQS